MEEENIITVRNRNLQKADEAFADFMIMLESYLNEKAAAIPGTYCDCKSKELENVVVNVMKELCGRTPFRAEEIRLVSAQYFPDIIAEKYYGVEVKSTKENHWTSTGSSIVESTRDKNVENIYMLFGKLGGKTAEFKCRPYEDCLSDIAVTHSPRYLINMELTKEQTIFSKMGVAYDQLRNAPDSIEIVRKYYREKAIKAKKKAMPWWLGTSAEESLEEHTDMNISLWVDNGEYADPERNKRLKAEIFILFPEVVSGNYENAALWLCTRRSVVNFHMRDTFSAGGQQLKLNDELLPFPLPHVVGELLESATLIKNYLLNSDDLDLDISEFRPELMLPNRYEVWLNDIWKRIHQLKPYKRKETIEELGGISLAEWIDRKYTLSVK